MKSVTPFPGCSLPSLPSLVALPRGPVPESRDRVPFPHPVRGPQAGEARREAAVLQEQHAAIRRLVLRARQRELRVGQTLLGGQN